MPKKRFQRNTVIAKKSTEKKSVSFWQQMRWSESYTSLLLGLAAVVVAVLFITFLSKIQKLNTPTAPKQDISSISTTQKQEPTGIAKQPTNIAKGNRMYTTAPGDNLWDIAQKEYNSGYNWVDIAKANNIDNPGIIYSGTRLVIPAVTPIVIANDATMQKTSTTAISAVGTISGTTYTVQKGDDLWNIAVRAYSNGYNWVDIAKANNLSNPSLIFSGNVLQIPR